MSWLQVRHSEEEWLQLLGPKSYNILRKEGTELPWSSPLNGMCGGCMKSL
jgi:peptide-methionine (R)-S-oxide reductase